MLSTFMREVYDRLSRQGRVCQCQRNGVNGISGDCVRCHHDTYHGTYDSSVYGCDNFVRTYILRYMAAHVCMAQYPMENTPALAERLHSRTHIRMVSLGGAYGNETIALLDLVHRSNIPARVTAFSVDRAVTREGYHDWMVPRFCELCGIRNCTARFVKADVTPPANRIGADVVFVPWILSEPYAKAYQLRILENAVKLASDDGFVIVMDRAEDALFGVVDGLLDKLQGVDILDVADCICRPIYVEIPANILNEYNPKRWFRTSYRVIRKAAQAA